MGKKVVVHLWTLCWVAVLSFYLDAIFFSLSPHFDLSWNLSFFTRIALVCWVWILELVWGFFCILLWVNISDNLPKMEQVPSVFYFLSSVLPGNMEALQNSEVAFWALDLPLVYPEAHTTWNAVEEISALIECQCYCSACLEFSTSFPVTLSGLGGGRERGCLVWAILLVGVIFCFGVDCFRFFKSVSQYRQQPRLAHISAGTEIQCPIVTALVDSSFMWPLILLLHGLLRTDFLPFLWFFKNPNQYGLLPRQTILGTGYDGAGSPLLCLKMTVPTCRNQTLSRYVPQCIPHLQPQFVTVGPKNYRKYWVSLTFHCSKMCSVVWCDVLFKFFLKTL